MGLQRVLPQVIKASEKKNELPQSREVEKTSTRPMETNINPRLQEGELIAKLIEELIEV